MTPRSNDGSSSKRVTDALARLGTRTCAWLHAARVRARGPSALLLPMLTAVIITVVFAPCALAGGNDGELIVIKAGRVITVSGEEFAPGIVVIEDGTVSAVGGGIEYPLSAKVIDARHETVMPGFVNARSRFGLSEYDRSGVHGDQSAASDVYLSQLRFDDLLRAGYTAICFVPDGSDIPGTASCFRTAGPDDVRSLAESAYLHVVPSWPRNGKATLRNALKKAKEEIEKVEKARKEWEEKQKEKAEKEKEKEQENGEEPEEEEKKDEGDENGDDTGVGRSRAPRNDEGGDEEPAPDEKKEDAKPEDEEFKPPTIDPAHQPLVDLIEHKEQARMMVRIDRAADLHHFDDVIELYDDLAYVLYLATARSVDYHHVVESLGERKAGVVLRPSVHFLQYTTVRYNLMAGLVAAGCEVSVIPWSDKRIELLRVRERLAELVRAGLPREAAVKSLTLNPAKVTGLAERLGSIEKDKEADLVFLDGDPLDPQSRVKRVMILGEVVWTVDEEAAGQ